MISEEILANAARVRAPRQKLDTGEGELNLDVSGTAVRVELPSWLRGRYAEFTADAADADVLFGDGTVEVVFDEETTFVGEVPTVHANTGRRIKAGQTRNWVVPKNATHMSVEASGAGALYIGVSSDPISEV